MAGVVGEGDAGGEGAFELVALALVEEREDVGDEGLYLLGGVVEEDDGGLVVGTHVDGGLIAGTVAAVAYVGVVADAFNLEAEAQLIFQSGSMYWTRCISREGGGLEDVLLGFGVWGRFGAEEAEVPGGELAEVDDGGGVAGGGRDAASVEGLDYVARAIALDRSCRLRRAACRRAPWACGCGCQ